MNPIPRARRFISTLWWLRQGRIFNRHNVRAAWIQSEIGWLHKGPKLDLSDEEFEAFIEAVS